MKVFNYTIMMVVAVLFFKFAGIDIGAESFLTTIGFNVLTIDPKTATLYLAIFGAAGILIGLAAGIAVGFITKSQPENFIILPLIIGSFEFFVISLTSIVSYALDNFTGWVSAVILLIFAPLVIGYFISLVEFFRGTD